MDNKNTKKAKKPTILERKIRYFFNRYEMPLDLEGFEILMLGVFDKNNKLVLEPTDAKMKKRYLEYWKRISNGNSALS